MPGDQDRSESPNIDSQARSPWPIADSVVLFIATGAFFSVVLFVHKISATVSSLVLGLWPFVILFYVAARANFFAVKEDNSRTPDDGISARFSMDGLSFFIAVLAGPLLLSFYYMSGHPSLQFLSSTLRPASYLIVFFAFFSIIFGLEIENKDMDGAVKEVPLASRLFVPISFVSGLVLIGTFEMFHYSFWLCPDWLLSWNQYIRLVVAAIWLFLLLFLTACGVGREIAIRNLGVGSFWKELEKGSFEKSSKIWKEISRAISNFIIFLSNCIKLSRFVAAEILKHALVAVKSILSSIGVGGLLFVCILTSVTFLGLIAVKFAPRIGSAAYLTAFDTQYDSALFFCAILIVMWSGITAVVQSRMNKKSKFEITGSTVSVILFSGLGIWAASVSIHILTFMGFLLMPGFGILNGTFFAIYSLFLLFLVAWNAKPVWVRIILLVSVVLVTLLWLYQAWPNLRKFSLPAQTEVPIASGQGTTNSGLVKSDNATTASAAGPALLGHWLDGNWGMSGNCEAMISISVDKESVTWRLADETQSEPIVLPMSETKITTDQSQFDLVDKGGVRWTMIQAAAGGLPVDLTPCK